MIESIFSTPLYYNFAEDQILTGIQSEISLCIDDIKLQYVQAWGKTHKISSDDILEKHDLANLENFIEHKKTGVSKYVYTGSSYFSIFIHGSVLLVLNISQFILMTLQHQ